MAWFVVAAGAGCSAQQKEADQLPLRRLEHGARVLVVAELGRGTALVGGTQEGQVVSWSLTTNAPPAVWKAHEQPIVAIACAPTGDAIATGCRGGVIKVWSAATRDLLWESRRHTGVVDDLCYTPDGSLVSVSHDTTVRVWDSATGSELRCMRHTAEVYSVAVSVDGALLLTGGDDQCLRIWDLRTDQPRQPLPGVGNQFAAIAISRDGRLVAAGPRLHIYEGIEPAAASARLRDRAYHGWLTAVTFAPDGKRFATGGSDGVVRSWEVVDGRERIIFDRHADGVSDVQFLSDGCHLAASDGRGVTLHRL